jgi:hypothetical protein
MSIKVGPIRRRPKGRRDAHGLGLAQDAAGFQRVTRNEDHIRGLFGRGSKLPGEIRVVGLERALENDVAASGLEGPGEGGGEAQAVVAAHVDQDGGFSGPEGLEGEAGQQVSLLVVGETDPEGAVADPGDVGMGGDGGYEGGSGLLADLGDGLGQPLNGPPTTARTPAATACFAAWRAPRECLRCRIPEAPQGCPEARPRR